METSPVEIPVVEVDGQLICEAAVNAEVGLMEKEAVASGETLSTERRQAIRSEVIDMMISRVLMAREARRLGLNPNEKEIASVLAQAAPRFDGVAGFRAAVDTEEFRNHVENRLLIDRLLVRWCDRVHAPRLSEVREFYRQNREQFWTPELVGAAHIVKDVGDGQEAELKRHEMVRIRDLLVAGEDFAETARRFSDCGDDGGNLGYFPRGYMVEEFDDVVFSAPAGTLTDVFRTRFGFHVAFIYDRKSEGIRRLEEVRRRIEQAILHKKQDREVAARLSVLRRHAKVLKIPAP